LRLLRQLVWRPFGFRLRQRGQQHARKNRDDGNDHEQFDQGKGEPETATVAAFEEGSRTSAIRMILGAAQQFFCKISLVLNRQSAKRQSENSK
jgi:hypothetical protein